MHRIDGAGHVDHLFVAEDPATLRPPTEITPEIMNAFQEELATFIEWAGIVLAKGDNTQLKQALLAKFVGLDVAATKAGVQGQTYTAFTTAGATGAFTLAPAPAIAAYAAGQRFRIKFHAVGSGADTINVSGLGAKNLKQYDSTGAKVAAVIAANQLADVEYDGVDMVIIDPLPPVSGITQSAADARYLGIGYMLVQHQVAQGTSGGSAAAGIQTRPLNTVVANTISGASLASNQITLPAGTYRVRGFAEAFHVNASKIALYNVTDATYIQQGGSVNGENTLGDLMTIEVSLVGRFTLAATKVLELRQFCEIAYATSGLGYPSNSMGVEVYAGLEIMKES